MQQGVHKLTTFSEVIANTNHRHFPNQYKIDQIIRMPNETPHSLEPNASHEFCVVGEYRYMIALSRAETMDKLRKLHSPEEKEGFFLKHADLVSLESTLPRPEDYQDACAAVCTDGQQIPGQPSVPTSRPTASTDSQWH